MADFGIPHLAGREADITAGRMEETMRAGRPQVVETRRVGEPHRIVGRVVAPTPAIQDYQHHGTTILHFRSLILYRCGSSTEPFPGQGPTRCVRSASIRRCSTSWRA